MSSGVVQIYYGDGHGKSTAALGNAIHAASEGKNVIVIQFLKGKMEKELEFLQRLEPEIKFFRFSKSDAPFDEILGLLDHKVITIEDIRSMMECRPEEMDIIFTGRILQDGVREFADEIYNIAPEK